MAVLHIALGKEDCLFVLFIRTRNVYNSSWFQICSSLLNSGKTNNTGREVIVSLFSTLDFCFIS